jgi:hypothetical protein
VVIKVGFAVGRAVTEERQNVFVSEMKKYGGLAGWLAVSYIFHQFCVFYRETTSEKWAISHDKPIIQKKILIARHNKRREGRKHFVPTMALNQPSPHK